jgi:hypothetical protein
MRVLPKSGCQLQRRSSSFRYVNSGPAHIQNIYSSAYSDFNIQVNVSALLMEISRKFHESYTAIWVPNSAHNRQFTQCVLWSRTYTKYLQLRIYMLQYTAIGICAAIVDITSIQRVILQTWCQLQRTSSSFLYVNSGPAHLQSIYSSAYICFNIRWNVSALLLEMWRQFNVRYTANLVTNTAHILQLSLCEQSSRTYTRYLHFRRFRHQYSNEGSSPAIGDISTILCALYCKLGAKYSAHPPVYTLWTVVPDIYNVITVTIFRLQYSSERIWAAIGYMSTIQW